MKLKHFEEHRNIAPKRTPGTSLPSRIALFFHTVDLHAMVKSFSLSIAATTTILFTTVVTANPQDGVVAAGRADIIAEGQKTTVLQHSNRAVINWKDFSIAEGEHTQFVQPNSNSIAVNRVTGGSVSEIYGKLTANGRVWILNPNGIHFGPTSYVNVSGVMASTLDLHNQDDFMSGLNNFQFKPFSGDDYEASISSSVVNKGTIVSDSGLAALVAPGVANYGVIKANLGNVVLGSGTEYTMDFFGDGLINFVIDKGLLVRPTAYDDSMDSLIDTMVAIDQRGDVIAEGGSILVQTGSAVDVLDNVINMSGNMRATSYEEVAGHIGIHGNTGRVNISGFLEAVGNDASEVGGSVHVLAQFIEIEEGARIDVSGQAGGGTILVGGDTQGVGELPTAQTTTVASGAVLKADSHVTGDAGTIVAWADEDTQFHGTASASALGFIGAGGFVETSGKKTLDITDAQVTASSVSEEGGAWLLDPTDFDVDGTNSAIFSSTLDSGTDVTIQTSGVDTGAEAGDVTFESTAAVAWSNDSADFFVDAHNDIIFDAGASVVSTGLGNVTLRADSDSTNRVDSTALTGGNAAVDGGTVAFAEANQVATDGEVNIYYGTADYTNPTDYSANVIGAAGENFYMLVNDVYDLQQINTNLGGMYGLGQDINAAGTRYWNSNAGAYEGFDPLGNIISRFTGTIDGQDYAIDSLYINRSASDNIGLLGYTNGATIKNIGITNAAVVGHNNVGGMIGSAEDGATIDSVFVEGEVIGADNVGGLVGFLSDEDVILSNSYSAGSVKGVDNIGGLIGQNAANTDAANVYSTARVWGRVNVGGLFGLINGSGALASFSLDNAYAQGDVVGNSNTGGIIGSLYKGDLGNVYSTGLVVGNTNTGALIGEILNTNINDDVSIWHSFFNSDTSFQENAIGNLYFAVPSETASLDARQFEGVNQTAVYTDTGGNSSVTLENVSAKTTTELETQTTFTDAGWDFTNINHAGAEGQWTMLHDNFYPVLQMENTSTVRNLKQLQLINIDLTGHYKLANNIDASRTAMWNDGLGFDPLGDTSLKFTGSLDGQLYVINDLTISRPSVVSVGLFGATSNAILSNIGIRGGHMLGSVQVGSLAGFSEGTSILNSYSESNVVEGNGGLYYGGLIGWATGGTSITNAYSSSTVNGGSATGGLVGRLQGGSSVKNSYTTGEVTGNRLVGGLVGDILTGSVADHVYSTASVSGSVDTIGGLVGFNDATSTVSFAYATGQVQGSWFVGGLAGFNNGLIKQAFASGQVSGIATTGGLAGGGTGTFIDSFWDTQTTAQTNAVAGVDPAGTTGLTTTQMFDESNYINWNFANNNDGVLGDWIMLRSDDYPHLQMENTLSKIFGIRNINELQLVDVDLTADYFLANNIDARETQGWNGGAGFSPISLSTDADPTVDEPFDGIAFTGSLDGKGYTVNDVVIDRSSEYYIGLFAFTEGATIENIGINDGFVNGKGFVGALIGSSNANTLAKNVYSSTSVRASGLFSSFAGGLIGQQTSSSLINAYTTGSTLGYVGVGGLVGINTSSSIANSYSTGDVIGFIDVGGLVGANMDASTIMNTYATGDVLGFLSGGGLVDINDSSSIINSYATGKVAGNSTAVLGGLVGDDASGTVTDSFWDIDTTGQTASAGGAGLKTTQMQDQSNFTNWDFANNGTGVIGDWIMIRANDYPHLQIENTLAQIFGIQNVTELQLIDVDLQAHYRLQNDIDASATATWNNGEGFDPIGAFTAEFSGTLDGQHYTISDLTITRPSEAHIGLFASLDSGAVIKNLGLHNPNIVGSLYVGGLAGSMSNLGIDSVIQHSYVEGGSIGNAGSSTFVGGLVGLAGFGTAGLNGGYLLADSWSSANILGNSSLGGIAGQASSGGVLNNVYSTGSVTGQGNLPGDIGGLLGALKTFGTPSTAQLNNVFSTGMVKSTGTETGGLIGAVQLGGSNAVLQNAYTTSSVMGSEDSIGGLIGAINPFTTNAKLAIIDSYSASDVSTLLPSLQVAGLIGYTGAGSTVEFNNVFWGMDTSGYLAPIGLNDGTVIGSPIGLTTAERSTESTFTNAGWDFTNNHRGVEGTWTYLPDGTMTPVLQSTLSAYIAEVEQLRYITLDLHGDYYLTQNIDASATSTWNGGAGFKPISSFWGMLDGQNFAINDLTINRPLESSIGLFANTSGSTIQNIGLVGGSVIGSGDVGALVGVAGSSHFVNNYSTMSVTGLNFVGGLIGNLSSSIVENSYATGRVIGLSDGGTTGGLIGLAQNSSTISQSFATGQASGDRDIGGLIGKMSDTNISNSYATGNVHARVEKLGGLIGTTTEGSGTISNTYALGNVSGDGGAKGAFIGEIIGDYNINSSYYNTANVGGIGIGSDGGTGTRDLYEKTLTNLGIESTFTNWDFTNSGHGPQGVWTMAGTPHLQMEYSTDITNVYQLQMMNMDLNLNTNYRILNDINALETASWNVWEGFAPIGSASALPIFYGSLDGQGYGIYDLSIKNTNPSINGIGLFSQSVGADIKNLTLFTPIITSAGNDVGSLIGFAQAGNVNNVSVINATVGGANFIGGLIGRTTTSMLENAYVTGNVTGEQNVGGLVGRLTDSSTLNNAYALSDVTGTGVGQHIGGITGAAFDSTINNTYAKGDVTGTTIVGGLIGLSKTSSVSNSFATGAVVSGDSNVGGLFGEDNSGVYSHLFWDTQTTAQTNAVAGVDPAGTTGLTTTQMKDTSSAIGALDFTNTWEMILPIGGTASYDYPHLQSEEAYGISVTGGNIGTQGDRIGVISDGMLTGFKGVFTSNSNYVVSLRKDIVPAGSHLLLFNETLAPANTGNTVLQSSGQDLITGNVGPTMTAIFGQWAPEGEKRYFSDITNAIGDLTDDSVQATVVGNEITFKKLFNSFGLASTILDDDYTLIGTKGIAILGSLDGAHTLTLKSLGTTSPVALISDIGSNTPLAGLIIDIGSNSVVTSIFTSDDPSINVERFDLQSGTWDQDGYNASTGTFHADDFRIASGTFTRFLDGDGTPGDPYQIGDVYGLQGVASLPMTNSYILKNEIDASVTESWNDGEGFMPIGSGGSAYQGIFNGEGHLIDGLTINRPTENYVGLFSATTGATVEIQHIGLTNVDIIGNSNVGALVGDVNNVNPVAGASISNVFVEGRVQGMSDNVGGVIGVLGTDATIDQAYSLGSVIGGWQRTGGLIGVINSGTNNVTNSFSLSTVVGGIFGLTGGFAGEIQAGAELAKVYAQGDVIGSNGSTNVGGFAGTYNGAVLDQAYSTGLVSGTGLNFTGFIGQNITGNITHSFWNTETSGYAIGVPPTSPQPGANELLGLTTDQLMTQSYISSRPVNNWNFTPLTGAWVMAGYPMLQAFNDTLVNNVIELQLMINDLSADYTLTADIDASDTVNWNAGAGFKPIGFTNGSEFIGQLDGNGYNISDLTINRPLEVSVGLFGKVAGNALAITNVNLVDIDIIANGFTGGLVGESSSNGTISDVSVSGTIDSAESWAGGLVGISNGNFNPTISNIYTDVDITGKFNLGGIAGTLSGTNATSGTTLKNVYSTGELTGLGQIGGIVGQNYIGVSIENSYSTSKINSTGSNVGAFIGFNGGNQVQNSFIDSSVNDVMNAIGGGTLGGVDKITTAELTNINTFTGWGSDFYENGGNTWIMAGLPHLQLELNLMRTSDNHFEIDDAVDLQLATLDLDGIYTLTQDIDASVTREWNCISSCTTGTPEYAGFEPIGSYNDRFLGTLDGQQHEIDGLYMKWDSGDFVALFEAVGEGALIKDLGLTSVHIEGGQRLAALAGYMTGASRVQNSYSTGNIYATNAAWAGGLIGIMQDDADSIIQNSYSTANVSGYAWSMGGLIGLFNSGKVFNSYTLGSVSNTAEVNSGFDTGGLTGIIGSQATIINSYAAGPITGNNAGGLMGSSQGFGGTVKNSFWDVDTTGQATSAAGTGLTHAEALTKSTYTNAGWDFTSIWQIPEGIDAPRLIAEGNLDAISGQVYDSSLSASAQNIGVVLGGGSSIARHTVSLSDGSYSFALSAREMENAAGDEVIIFVDNNTGFTANTLFRKEDDVDVTDLNLIQDTIIAGYENGTDVDMALLNDATKNYMSSSIGYTVSGSTLDTSSNAFIANNEYSTGSNETIISTSDRGIAFNDTLELSSGDITLDNNASTGNVYLNADILSTPADTYNLNIDAGPGAIVLDGNVIKPNDISFLANEAVIAGNLQLVNTTAFDFPLHFRGDTVFSSTSTGATALNFQEAISSDYSMLTLNMLIGKQILAGSTVDLDTFYLERGVWAQDLLNPTLQTFSARDFRLGDVDVAVFLRGNFNSFPNIFISDVYGLQGIGSTSLTLNPGANISLSENIDASGTEHWYDGAGFRPIGDSSNPYQGTFDGQDFSITGLTILTTNKNTGLFGYTDSASIHNVELMDADIDSTETYTGALIGQAVNGTTVTQVHSSGVVYGGNNTGGLIGDLNNSAVFESFSIADVYSTGDNVGGLVGVLGGSATATDTYARGDVTALDAVGGLVGTQTGTSLIKTSYSSGNVTATDIVVAGQGALVGEKTGGDIENSYALKDAGLGVNVGLNMVGSDGLILGLKDDTQMRKASTFDGFDFASIWEMLGDPENSVDYPVFQFQDLFSIYGRVLDTLNMNLPAETVNLASNGVIQAGVTTVSSAATDPNNNYALIFSEKDFVGDEAILLFLSSGVANTVFELYDDAGVIPSLNLDIKQGEVRAVSFADSINEPSNTLLSTAAINTLGYTVAGTDVTVDSGLAFHSLADTSFTVDGDITTTAANIQFDTIASVNSGKNLSTKAGDLLFNSDLTLNGNNVLSTSAVNVTFNNTASFDGSNTFNADGGNLHFAGVTNFVGGPNVITTTGGAIDFDSNVNLDNSINNFNTAGGDVTFGGPLANTGTSAVTIAAGTGDLIFTSGNPIGTALDPITLTVNSVNHVELPVGLFEVVKTQVASSVHLSEAGRFNDAMNLLKVGGTLDIANTYPGGEPFIIEADEGILLKLENPMLNVPIVDIQGDVNFLTDATLTSDTSFDVAGDLIFADGTQIVFNALNDNISFMDPATVNGPGDLTLNSDTPVDLFAQIGNVTRLNSIHFPGVLNVVGDSSVSAGTVLFDDAITNSTPVDLTVSAPASGGFIRFGGQVSSPGTPMTLAVPEGGTAHLYAPIYTPLSLHQVYVVNRFNTGRLTDAWAIMRTSADFTQPFGISRPGLSRIGLPYNPLYPYHLNEMDEKLKVFLVPNKIIYIHDELQSNLTYVPGPYNDVISGFIY